MQKHILFGIIGLIAGLAIGFIGANSINRDAPALAAVSTAADILPPANSSAISQSGTQADVQQTLDRAAAEPKNFAVQMKTGDMYAQIGRFDKAIEFYKQGIALKPDDFQANVVIANAYFDSGKFEDAEGYYTKALDLNPKDVNARTDLGATFVERANPDYERSLKEFRTALEMDPKNEPALYYLGIAYLRKGDVENAKKALSDLEQTNPASPLIAKLTKNIEK